jgi:hypothetical protein
MCKQRSKGPCTGQRAHRESIDAIDKIRKSFLWRGRKEAKGDTVWWLGARCVAHFSLEDWVSLVYRNLDTGTWMGPPDAMAVATKNRL